MRRRLALVATLLALAVVWLVARRLEANLARASFFTGGTALATLFLLAALGIRRRLPVLRLGSVSLWTQVHIYSGIFSLGVYLIHVPAVIGNGIFESSLSMLFLLVSLSGMYGVYASRTLPKRLTAVDGQHRFDRVAWHREQIAEAARRLLEGLREQSEVQVLGGFYQTYLLPFFGARPSLVYVLVPSGARRRRLLTGLRELDRYLEPESRSTAGQFAALVRRRDDLDYQFVLQLRLRLWLVVHGVFSVVLVSAAIVHAVIAWRFVG